MPINPRLPARITDRGQHPDLDADGNSRADPWDRKFVEDPGYGAAFMDAVTAEQSALPVHIQQEVQGRTFAPGRSVSEGIQAYNNHVKSRLHEDRTMLRGEWNRLSPERQDELEAEGWRVHDPFNREGRIDLKLAEQWSDWTTMSEYNQAAARARGRR